MRLPGLGAVPSMASLPIRQRVVAMVLAICAVISGVVLVLTLAVDDDAEPAEPTAVTAPTILDGGDYVPAGVQGEVGRALGVAVSTVGLTRTYDGDALESSRREAQALMTPDYAAEFDAEFDDVVVPRAEAGVTSQGVVRGAGVVSADQEQVECLVYVDARVTGGPLPSRNAARREAAAQWRVLVTVVRADGEWLVDRIEPV